MALPRFHIERTALLVVDLQEKLLPLIHDAPRVERQCVKLIRGCSAVGVPIAATEQYPRGLGATVASVRSALPPTVQAEQKLKFSACVEGVRQKLCQWATRSVVVCGIESHVCVTQTVLDLLAEGYLVGVAADAIGARSELDDRIALQRMIGAGAVPMTVEMLLFELVHEAGTDRFKALLPVVRSQAGVDG
jgi:nicotinamidase-related amidase